MNRNGKRRFYNSLGTSIKIRKRSIKKLVIENGLFKEQRVKPYFDEDEIIKKINKSIFINDSDNFILKNFLHKNSYFRFNIYVKLMKDNEGITISDVIRTYQLDEFIRENLFIFSTRLEIFWKKKIIDTLCAEYQESHLYHVSQCYLDKDLYSGDEWGQKVINDFSSFFYTNKSPNFKHHHNDKKNYLPIWALVEELTFGQLTTFISQIKPTYSSAWAMACYNNPKYKSTLNSWMNVVRLYRNKSAHGSRIFGLKAVNVPQIIRKDFKYYFPNKQEANLRKSYLYGALYVFKHLLIYEDNFTQRSWNRFLLELNNRISLISGLDQNLYGLPEDWFQKLRIMII